MCRSIDQMNSSKKIYAVNSVLQRLKLPPKIVAANSLLMDSYGKYPAIK